MIDIYQTIPHRPPFLFIDEVVELTEDTVVATRTIRADEPQFEGHYPGNPIMPGVLLCESTFQAGAILLVNRMQGDGESADGLTPVLTRISDAKFKQMVKPGDQIRIEVKYKESLGKFHFLSAKIFKEEKVALTISFSLALIQE